MFTRSSIAAPFAFRGSSNIDVTSAEGPPLALDEGDRNIFVEDKVNVGVKVFMDFEGADVFEVMSFSP